MSLLRSSAAVPLTTDEPATDEHFTDLTGYESQPHADFHASHRKPDVKVPPPDACWLRGNLTCSDGHIVCKGFGEVECQNLECKSSPGFTCRREPSRAKCRGHAYCPKAAVIAASSSGSGSMSWLAVAILLVTLTLGFLVLAATAFYVYVS